MISSTKHIDSGSSSRPTSTWKLPAGIQRVQVLVDRALVGVAAEQREEQHDADDERQRPACAMPSRWPHAVGAAAAEQQHRGAEQRQRDEQPASARSTAGGGCSTSCVQRVVGTVVRPQYFSRLASSTEAERRVRKMVR